MENDSGYRFYHSEKGLVESRDTAFMETTNLVTPIDQIFKLLDDTQVDIRTHVNIDVDHDMINNKIEQNTQVENSGSKQKREPSVKFKDHCL